MWMFREYHLFPAHVIKDSYFRVAVDLGCGCGTLSKLVRPNVGWLIGVDLNIGRLRVAEKSGLYDELYLADIMYYEPPPETEVVFLTEVVEHLSKEDGVALLKRLIWVPVIVLTTPQKYCSLHRGHISHWTVEDLNILRFNVFTFDRGPLIEKLFGKGLLAFKAPMDVKLRFIRRLGQPR